MQLLWHPALACSIATAQQTTSYDMSLCSGNYLSKVTGNFYFISYSLNFPCRYS